MEAKGEISMRMVHCEDCGKRYDYDVDGFCPRCGAFNQPAGDGDAPQLEKKPEFQQREKPQAAKQEKAKVSCAHLGEHICPQCEQFGALTQGLLRGQK